MSFLEIVNQAIALLRTRGRISYRVLKREFALDDEALQDLKDQLIEADRVAVDESGKVLVWIGEGETAKRGNGEKEVVSPQLSVISPQPLDASRSSLHAQRAEAERRQLTVMFCDLVGSTALSTQLDPEDLRTVIQAYRETCATVIRRFEGHLAQYIGDGLLVYFGYPVAHEDDAARAVRTGLEIVEAIQHLSFPTIQLPRSLQVRIGIHTGLVVAGEMGTEDRPEPLGIVGETPNIAARLQGLAEPNTVIISAATQHLVDGHFECQPFGSHLVKGIDTPIAVYYAQNERQSTAPLASKTTLTPLVGREQEVGLLYDHWEQVKEGRGQVVLLSGEPGIGKSRLAYTLKEHVTAEGSLLFELRCSSYSQHSALYPLIDALQRTLRLTRQDTDIEKIEKIERALALYSMQETLPLFTALLSLPTPSQYPSLNLTPQKQKERTLQAMWQWLAAQAERQATVVVWEDLHWVDPSSLEFLTLWIEQIPTTKLLLVLTFRPEFAPPWKLRSHLTQLTLNRLGQKQVEAMIEKAAAGKNLPAEVVEQIRVKTDGVPLFIEELTKAVIETITDVGATPASPLQLAIPATLQETLLARLDRLSTARQIAQLGATLGREFSYELLHAVTPVSETDLQTALAKLVEAEILYQRGVGPQTHYFFKHALIQDMAYQSLPKSMRQRYHQQIAQVLQEQFPAIKDAQPELLAHHYTEAGFSEQAIPYWQQAGQQAVQRSANVEAISHLTKGLELLKTLPDTPERAQRELMMQIALGGPLIATRGYAAPAVEQTYTRARELCQQMGEVPQLFPVLRGLWAFYNVRAEYKTARELGEQCLSLAQRQQDPALLVEAHYALGNTLSFLGEFASGRVHLEQGVAVYNSQQYPFRTFLYGQEPRVGCLSYAAIVLWCLGYPDQAFKRSQEALALAYELSHPFSLGFALYTAAWLSQFQRKWQATQEQAEACITLSIEQGFALVVAAGTIPLGWALAEQGRGEEGIVRMRQGLAAYRATGAELGRPFFLALMAEVYGKVGQAEEGLSVVAEALTAVDKPGERWCEAELYRLKGELMLQSKTSPRQVSDKSKASQEKSENPSTQPLTPSTQAEAEAEACFVKAIEVAQKQQAKSLELRAATSLARLWQRQGKQQEAHDLLSKIYGWFTEGFDTKDLQEAEALLAELEK